MENVVSNKTHKKYSVKVEYTRRNIFQFLVPNHLLDKDGNITDEIKKEISNMFSKEDLTYDDCVDRDWFEEGCEVEMTECLNDIFYKNEVDEDLDGDLMIYGS